MTQKLDITVQMDGDQWCALLGPNLQEGTAGFGDTISDALHQLAFRLEHQDISEAPIPKLKIDDELLEKVTRYLAIKPFVKECEDLHKLIKTAVEGEEHLELGIYDITGKSITRKPYTAQVKESTYWKMEIKPNPGRMALVKR